MIERDVQRFEIVEFVFDLGTVNDGEPETPHQILELENRLRQGMPAAERRMHAGQSRIESAGDGLGTCQFPLAAFKRGGHPVLHFIEPLAPDRALILRGGTERRLQFA
jgi:hypothetical protein